MNTQNQIIALTESFLNNDITNEEFNTQVRVLENNLKLEECDTIVNKMQNKRQQFGKYINKLYIYIVKQKH